MAKASISKRTVDAAKPAVKDQFLWDKDVSGFGLKVTPSGSKIYIFQYRIARPGEAERTTAKRYTIGKHGKLTPDQARKRAKELAALVEQGIDPRQRDLDAIAAEDKARQLAEERAALEGMLAFENIAALWLDQYENEKDRRPSSVRMAKMVVNNHLKPRLARKPFPHIDRSDIQQIIDAIPVKQRATRRAVFAYASVLFGWAHIRGDISDNPLRSMAKPEAPKARDRVLSNIEIREVWNASQELSHPFGHLVRLLILTGQRRSEVAELIWSELDRSTATWTIPANRSKNDVAHIVPLSDLAIAELDQLAERVLGKPQKEDQFDWPKEGFVLTTTGRSPVSGISKAKRALDEAISTASRGQPLLAWRLHDLRRTLATGFQRLGVRFEVTEAVLNHISGAKGGVAGIYQRHDWKEEKRAALQVWASHIRQLEEPIFDQKVVELRNF
jgi:integrase